MPRATPGASSSTRASVSHAPAPFARVLALADPSGTGALAVAHAGFLARAAGAELAVFHASDPGGFEHGASPAGAVRSAADRLARATLEVQARATGVPRGRRQVVLESAGATAATMAGAARRTAADLVVIAPRHNRGRLARVLGSSLTAATVGVFRDRIPVLCARGEARPYRRIVVGTDFTSHSRRSVRMAARLAALFGGEVSVVHVPLSRDDDASVLAAMRRFLPTELSCRAPQLLVEHGEPWAAVVAVAARKAADLVVVSAGGPKGVREAVLGSQAERVIRHAACPVLVT